jgi:GTP-binding protein
MKVRSVEFAGSIVNPLAPLPGSLPQVAFAGRSNVGKSSLINTLLRRTRKKLARVSGEPGKTREVNFFRVNDRFFLVDLPGYGFARVPEAIREGWKTLMEGYLSREDGPLAVVHLVDSRHDPAETDLRMLAYLAELGIPTMVALTKVDKLKSAERARKVPGLIEALGLDSEQVIPFSSKTGEGREELLAALDALLRSAEGEDGVERPSGPEGATPGGEGAGGSEAEGGGGLP